MKSSSDLHYDWFAYLAAAILVVASWGAVGAFLSAERASALRNVQLQLDVTVARLADANELAIAAQGTTANQQSDSRAAAIWSALLQFPTASFWVKTDGEVTAGEAPAGTQTDYVTAQEIRGRSTSHAALPRVDALKAWRSTAQVVAGGVIVVNLLLVFLARVRARALRHRAKAEDDMAAALVELRLRDRALESISQGIVITDRRSFNAPIVYTNPAFSALLKLSPDQIVGRHPRKLFHPDVVERIEAQIRTTPDNAVWSLEIPITREDGSEFIDSMSGSGIADPDGKITHGVVVHEDVTEHRKRDEMVLQAQKMESVGQLTGGIAHDFNNLLTAVRSCAEDLRDELADPYQKEQAEIILQASERGAGLVSQLMAFARKQELQPKTVDVNSLVDAFGKLMRSTLPANIEVTVKNNGPLPSVFVDPGRLETALVNLAVNARDAMPQGGALVVETSKKTLDADYAATHPEVRAGDYVQIAVTDSGSGMPAHVLEKVFTPFFTTKEVGKGTGLGLSMVYGFLKQSGGHVNIYSELGHGTVVKIYLPPQEQSETSQPADFAQAALASRGGAILLVEDDPLVRQTIGNKLTSLGFQVVNATNASEAIETLKSNDCFDLVFSDIIMPGAMTGADLVEEVRLSWPHIRVLLTSGYTESNVLGRIKIPDGVRLLSKPYSNQELAQAIHSVLGPAAQEA